MSSYLDDASREWILQKARQLWDAGEARQAGGLIFESIPVAKRHLWAFDILDFAYSFYPQHDAIDAVLTFAKTPDQWNAQTSREAHHIVDNVNHTNNLILDLATQAGKIVYTAQQFPAPFDHNAGWRIVEYLKKVLQEKNDPDVEEAAWQIVANSAYIMLPKPVRCHPACPTCSMGNLKNWHKVIVKKD